MEKEEILSLIEELHDKKEFEKFFTRILTEFKNKKFVVRLIEKKFDIIFDRIEPQFVKRIYFSIPLPPEIQLLLAKFLFRYGDIEGTKDILKNLKKFFHSLSTYNKYFFISLYSAILIEEGNVKKALYYINKGLSYLPKKFTINLKIFKNEIIHSYLSPENSYSELLCITKKLKDKRKFLSLLIQEAVLNFYKGKFEKSYNLIEECIEIAKNKKIYDMVVISSCFLSKIERLKGNFEKSSLILNSLEEFSEKCGFLGKYYFLIEKASLYIDEDRFNEAMDILSKINEKDLPILLKTNYYLLLMRLTRKEKKLNLFYKYSEKFFSIKFLELVKKWEGLVEKFFSDTENLTSEEILKCIKIVSNKKLIFFEFLFETSLFYFYLRRKKLEKAKKILMNFKKFPEEFFGYFRRDSSIFYEIIKENKLEEFMFSESHLKKIMFSILSNKGVLLNAIKNNGSIVEFLPEIIVDKKIYSKSIFKELKKKGKKAKKIMKEIFYYFQIEPPDLIIKFFGNFEIILQDEKIVLQRKKLRQFFKILVFMKNTWVSKAKIVEILYGNYSEKYTKSLSILFSFLKNELGIFLERNIEGYRFLERKNVYIDYFDFEEKKNMGIVLFEKNDYIRAIDYFEKFINEIEKEFLEEDKGIEFFDEIISKLKKERVKVLEKMVFIYEILKNKEKEIECLEKIIRIDPYFEFPYKKLISLYEEMNEKTKAKLVQEKFNSIKNM
ncbi:MAG: hypothetical protein ABIM36_06495 [candidate division WOR-3 bacterium]